MSFVFFESRIINKDAIIAVYVQYRAFEEDYAPVCELSGSKSPLYLSSPTNDVNECKKIIEDFYNALRRPDYE